MDKNQSGGISDNIEYFRLKMTIGIGVIQFDVQLL